MLMHGSFSPAERGGLLVGVLRLADIAVVLGAGAFAFWLRNDIAELPAHYVLAVVLGAFGIANVAQGFRLYDFQSLVREHGQFGRITLAWATVVTILIVVAYFTKTSEGFSRLWAATWFLTVSAGLIVVRVIAINRIESWREDGKLTRRSAVVGTGSRAEQMRRLLADQPARDAVLVGVFSPERLEELLEAISEGRVDDVIITLPAGERETLSAVVRRLGTISVEVRYAPDGIDLPFPVLGTSFLGGAPLLEVHHRPLSIWSRVTKRLEDLILGSAILVALAPLMAVVALLVKTSSPGPALFRQRRLGFNNNAFTMYKFRTMREETSAAEAGEGPVPQARRDDPRITRVGRFLRRTSLDELPQLFNVIRGEMSLVGPRPHAIAHNREYAEMIDGYLARHRVKPGMTGWAQVNGLRGETDTLDKMRARVEHDVYYINHWSLWLDLKILAMTLLVGFIHRNAY